MTSAFVAAAAAIIANSLYMGMVDVCRVPHVLASFEVGSQRPPAVPHFVDRAEIAMLNDTFRSPPLHLYLVALGERGCGKTTALQHACHAAGAGVIYVEVPQNPAMFPDKFAEKIGFSLNEHATLWHMGLSALGLVATDGTSGHLQDKGA